MRLSRSQVQAQQEEMAELREMAAERDAAVSRQQQVPFLTHTGQSRTGQSRLPVCSRGGHLVQGLISQKVFIESLCRCQFPHKSVNLSSITTNTHIRRWRSCGRWRRSATRLSCASSRSPSTSPLELRKRRENPGGAFFLN